MMPTRWCSLCVRVLVTAVMLAPAGGLLRAAEPDLTVTPIQRDGQVLVSFELTDAFSPDVRDAIQSGLPTTFSYEIDMRRGAARRSGSIGPLPR